MKQFLLLCCTFFLLHQGMAQSPNFWTDINESQLLLPASSEVTLHTNEYRLLALDLEGINAFLRNAPMENTGSGTLTIELPMPDGSMERYLIEESPVMRPGLAAKFPEIKSYIATSITNPSNNGRIASSPDGFYGSFLTMEGEYWIDPYGSNQTDYYASYYLHNLEYDEEEHVTLSCGLHTDVWASDALEGMPQTAEQIEMRNNGVVELRVYDLALACTGEYANTHGGTVSSVMTSFNTAINRLNLIIESEVAVRMMIIDGNDAIIFTDPDTDPYTTANDAGQILNENRSAIVDVGGIPFDSFDAGHVFTNGCIDNVGGLAARSSACRNQRARGITCHSSSDIDAIVRRIMAHEIGHQFSLGHTWNRCPTLDNENEQYHPESAYEPGSGSTIMSYAGSCGGQNVQSDSDEYYNIGSLQEFVNFTRAGDASECADIIVTDNNEPEVSSTYEDGFYIPISTPFELTATATDPDGDDITYCWEQYNVGPQGTLGNPVLTAPTFRSYEPRVSGRRVFPRNQVILSNASELTEVLPTYDRNLTFRCTVRDKQVGGGGTVWEEVSFEATESAGPFLVTSPNTADVMWEVGDYVEVTWDVANTTNALVNCQEVDILLSTDGGSTFPIVLADNTPNDGAEFITVPNNVSSLVRVKIMASNNIFFDYSNQNFDIVPAAEPGFALTASPTAQQICLPDLLEVELTTDSLLGFNNPITLEVTGGLPAGTEASFSTNPVNPTESTTLSLDFANANANGEFLVEITATAEGAATEIRYIALDVISNDFSDLQQLTPIDGTPDVLLSTEFTWTDAAGASTYDIEIATSPTFGATIVESAQGLTDTSYNPTILFEDNTLYYWRIRPINDCGEADFLVPFTFHTASTVCSPSEATDVPINISGTGTPMVQSSIFVTQDGTISDLNIPYFKGSYQPVNSIRLTLTSPAGTEVILFDQDCGNTLNLELGFDDDAPSEITCPPDDGIVNQPVGDLASFNGESTQGEWVLTMDVVETGFGGGGSLDEWQIEFCATNIPNAPFIVTNETMETPPNLENTITPSVLEVQDEDNSADELEYTLVTVPENGFLIYLGDNLNVGDNFRQSTIDAFNLTYLHDGSATDTDSFIFTVEDGTGGFLPPTQFNIVIDEDATVDTDDIYTDNDVIVYPNPTDNLVNIKFANPVNQEVIIDIQNVQGQIIGTYRFDGIASDVELNTSNLADGVYFLNIQSENTILSKKVVIQR